MYAYIRVSNLFRIKIRVDNCLILCSFGHYVSLLKRENILYKRPNMRTYNIMGYYFWIYNKFADFRTEEANLDYGDKQTIREQENILWFHKLWRRIQKNTS